jgi:uncharacterized protein
MNHYIIDGNNLIGKIKSLKELQKKDKQGSRGGLVNMLNNFFAGKKLKTTLHLDGHPNTALNYSKGKVVYSEKRSSDSMICEEIDNSKNPKLITVVSSDNRIINYARANSCTSIKSEDFYKGIKKSYEKNEEQEKLKQLEKDKDFFFDIFNKR